MDEDNRSESLFTNKCIYTKEVYREVMLNYNKLLRTIVLVLVGLLLLLALPAIFYSRNNAVIKLVCSTVALAVLFFYLLPVLTAFYMYKRDRHLHHETICEYITFFNDYFLETAYPSKAETRINYSQIKRVVETKRFFLIAIKYQVFFIIDKDNFQGINPIDFKKFIKEKVPKAKFQF